MTLENDALRYHKEPRPGKIEVTPSKPCLSQSDLSLAYTPGVAVPCLEIREREELSFDYTIRGNLVGVITNGTAVLGLGNIGPLAGKPVMEGKAVLFKRFADLDVFDMEVNTTDPDEFIRAVELLEPTFGGINLEDIKAPDCFYIEEELTKRMSIPVFHDDQHGTAIISAAALLNACELNGRRMEDLRVVINGAGAAAIASARMYMAIGVRRENLFLVDSRGLIYKGRASGMNPYKEQFANDTDKRTLMDAVRGAHVLVGLSVKGAFTPELLSLLAENPVIFPLANPDPEIGYEEAKAARPDKKVIVLNGDGAFGITAMDFETLVRFDLPVVVVIGNDAGWGLEREFQGAVQEANVACELRQTRYDLVMKSLGGEGENIVRRSQLAPAVKRAFAYGRPYLLNVNIRGVPSPFSE